MSGSTITTSHAATTSSPASSTTSATLVAANVARKGLIIQNTDANALYIKFGATAVATDFSVKIPGNDGYWEMLGPVVYTGIVDGIWAADGSGEAFITELV